MEFEDRISALPDDLLLRILLLVPTKDAVATMILSKRWRTIWTMLPLLKYTEIKDVVTHKTKSLGGLLGRLFRKSKRPRSIWWFLNESLRLHKAPRLERLDIELGPHCPIDANVGKWIASAVDRRVYVDVSSPVCLPSLKRLELVSVVYKDDDSVVRLLSSCPILIYLYVVRHSQDNVTKFSVKVPSLVTFDYYNSERKVLGEEDVEGSEGSLVIDSTILKEFTIADIPTNSCSIENNPRLDKTRIYFCSYPDDKFMKSLSSVRYLDISLSVETQPDDVPLCLSTKLEIFEWKEYRGTGVEKQVIRYILANSKCLKRVGISLKSTWKWNKKKIVKELKFMYRISTTSQLLFYTQLDFGV
ncbi:PREDICTED: putative F-box/FBD/LRR-repeat protein At1g22000 [Camelina sativa]|uniref:F-box/FBD/LRR-repeat protein At1g22000 n=1 Tax=Camelina sativa TaxID=90675 RepID=A0ABM0V6R1_CAMSA|nr:PREDICTED: putative F-box/FBD/LRR-repeat protein At1g22000 [Camelina sativa]